MPRGQSAVSCPVPWGWGPVGWAEGSTALPSAVRADPRSEEHTSELQSLRHLVCRLLLEKKHAEAWYCSQDSTACSRWEGQPPRARCPRRRSSISALKSPRGATRTLCIKHGGTSTPCYSL